MARFGIIGSASDLGGKVRGSAGGPDALRQAGIVRVLEALGHQVVDHGNSSPVANSSSPTFSTEEQKTLDTQAVYSICHSLALDVEKILQGGEIPIVLGGDHSLSLGSVTGVSNYYAEQQQSIGLIWVDAHPDVNTPRTSPSSKLFGMPVAFLAGLVPGAFSNLSRKPPALRMQNVSFIGLRDVDPGERELMRKEGIAAFSMKEIDIQGISAVVAKAIEVASRNTAGFVVSFDLDVCDPQLVPGTGTPYRGGLTFRESHLLLEMIAESNKLLAFELVELNPTLDRDGQTVELAISFLESVAGKTIL